MWRLYLSNARYVLGSMDIHPPLTAELGPYISPVHTGQPSVSSSRCPGWS